MSQEESVQTVQQQLEGTQQQQQLVQERLRHSRAPAQQAQASTTTHTSSHAYPQPSAYQHNQAQTQDQAQSREDKAYLNGQAYTPADTRQQEQEVEADMDFEPPGSAKGDPSEDPFGWEGGSDRPENGQDTQEEHQQGQLQDELYTPSLPAEPSGSYMADTSLQRECSLRCCLVVSCDVQYSAYRCTVL